MSTCKRHKFHETCNYSYHAQQAPLKLRMNRNFIKLSCKLKFNQLISTSSSLKHFKSRFSQVVSEVRGSVRHFPVTKVYCGSHQIILHQTNLQIQSKGKIEFLPDIKNLSRSGAATKHMLCCLIKQVGMLDLSTVQVSTDEDLNDNDLQKGLSDNVCYPCWSPRIVWCHILQIQLEV